MKYNRLIAFFQFILDKFLLYLHFNGRRKDQFGLYRTGKSVYNIFINIIKKRRIGYEPYTHLHR